MLNAATFSSKRLASDLFVSGSTDRGAKVTFTAPASIDGVWKGNALLSSTPLGTRYIDVSVVPQLFPQAVGSSRVTFQGQDASPPQIIPVDPRAGSSVQASPSGTPPVLQVKVVGACKDAQSGMVGGHASVTIAVNDQAGPKAAPTPTVPGDWSNWTATVTVPSLGPFTLYVAASDNQGNSTTLAVPLVAVTTYTPATLEERLGEYRYLLDLMTFTSHVFVDNGNNSVTATEITDLLNQPLARIAVPLTSDARAATATINELRIPIELLRAHINAKTLATTPGQDGERAYRATAYQTLVLAASASYEELGPLAARRPQSAKSLAQRLGFTLTGSSPSGTRPDRLDELTTDADDVTRASSKQPSVYRQRPGPTPFRFPPSPSC